MNERPGISSELLRLLIAILAIAFVLAVLLIDGWAGFLIAWLGWVGGMIAGKTIARVDRLQRPNVDDLIRRRTEAEIRRLRKEME